MLAALDERQNEVQSLQNQLEKVTAENEDMKKLTEKMNVVADDDKYNLPRESERLSKAKDASSAALELEKQAAEIASLKKLVDSYQQNHGPKLCTKTSSLSKIKSQLAKIQQMCAKNKRACLQKLKESSNNPLLHFKQQRSSSSDSCSSERSSGSSSQISDDCSETDVGTSMPKGTSPSPSMTGKKDVINTLSKNARQIHRHLKNINKFNE